jgi:hypothetical protein
MSVSPPSNNLDMIWYANVLLARAYAVMPFVWSIGTILGPGKFVSPQLYNIMLTATSRWRTTRQTR